MPATALLRFVQGATVGQNGRALKGVLGVAVEVRNSVNTDVASWQLDLVYADPGSGVVPATPFAFGNSSGTPLAIFTPDRAGSYRWVLKVWGVPNRVGTPTDVDIRNFVVPEENGLYVPPVQIWPRPLPPPASGEPGAKPNELNFNGLDEGWGWAGDGDDDGGLNELIRRVDALVQINLPEPGVDDGKQAVASNGNLVYVSSGGVPLSMVRVVDEDTATLLADQNGSAGSPYASVQDAIDDVPTGGIVVIVKATAAEPLTIAKDVAIMAWRADVWGAFGDFENGGEDVVVGNITITGSREVALSGFETGTITCSAGTSTILPNNGAKVGQITGAPILKAAATSFKSAGNVISGPSEIRDSNFQVNGTLITTSGTTLELQACRFTAGGNTIVFSGAPGTLFVDPIAYQFWSDVTETLTNGTLSVYGKIIPVVDATLTVTGDTLGRAAIAGDFNVAAGSNTSAFRSFSENSFLMKGTGAGVPTDVSVVADRFLGRSGSTALGPITGTQATAMLDAFTPTLKGLSTASGGGTTNYQRADGSWTNPADLPNNVALRGETTTPASFENLIKLDTNNAVVLGDGWVTGFAAAPGPLPTVGILRFPHNSTILAAATAAAGNDSILTYGVLGNNFVHLNGLGGLRLQGAGGIAQLGDNSFQFLSLATPFVVSTNDRSDANAAPLTVRAGGATSGNTAGRSLRLQGGRRAGTGDMGPVSIELNQDSSTTYPMVEAVHLANLRRVLSLVRGAALTTTQMPTGTGDLVAYMGNCATPPSENPVDGVVFYIEAGVAKCRDPSGAITILGPVAFTGDVVKSAGSNSTTIANDAVTNAKLANMAAGTVKGRAPGAGTGDPTDRTDASVVDGGLGLIRLGPTKVGNTATVIGSIPLTTVTAGLSADGTAIVEFDVYAAAIVSGNGTYSFYQKAVFAVHYQTDPSYTLTALNVELVYSSGYFDDGSSNGRLVEITVDQDSGNLRLLGDGYFALGSGDADGVTAYAVAKVTPVQPALPP